ncbi:MAG: Arsenate-mycothiol transferase ArsC2 [Candidatus Brocadia sinica]|nr:MAG: Arsenate-mycothiol transferase ArsC2 [Candidatus Brocadia sinica]
MFVCVENACRSQMAEGIFKTLTDSAAAKSAGTEIAGEINPVAIEVMKERGIDISQQKPKVLDKEMIVDATKIITMDARKTVLFGISRKRKPSSGEVVSVEIITPMKGMSGGVHLMLC